MKSQLKFLKTAELTEVFSCRLQSGWMWWNDYDCLGVCFIYSLYSLYQGGLVAFTIFLSKEVRDKDCLMLNNYYYYYFIIIII